MTVKVGVVGLGAMGAPIAINLFRAGMLAAVWNRTAKRTLPVTEVTGIAQADSLQSLAAQCEVIILSVSADADVLAVIDALLPSCNPGTIIVDTSTISVGTAIQAQQSLLEEGVFYLDAPVSGGVEGARKATLSMMIGGDEGTLDKVRPVLEAISSRIVYMGVSGNGQATKAVNQIMAAGINQAVTEALAFAQGMHLPMQQVIEAVGSGAAGNWFLSHRGPTMVEGKFEPGFRIVLHDKDLAICESMAKEKGMQLPLVAMTRNDYQQLIADDHGDDDISGLFRLKARQ